MGWIASVPLLMAVIAFGGGGPARADEHDSARVRELESDILKNMDSTNMDWARSAWADTDTEWLMAYAQMYEGPGRMQDVDMAVLAYRVAAERGHVLAYVRLGRMHKLGQVVEKDYFEAASWFRKAAEAGDAAGQTKLGALYFLGIGVPHDYVEAARLFRAAALQGDAAARARLGMAYATGKGVEQDSAEAMRWLLASEKPGFADASFSLGRMYERGIEVTANTEQAKHWYRKAAEQGHDEALERLMKLER